MRGYPYPYHFDHDQSDNTSLLVDVRVIASTFTHCVACGKIIPRMGVRGAPHYDMAPHLCTLFCGSPTVAGPACLNHWDSCHHKRHQDEEPTA